MPDYRYYSTTRGKIFSSEDIEAATDDEVVRAAEARFYKRAWGGFEIWDRDRFIYRRDEVL